MSQTSSEAHGPQQGTTSTDRRGEESLKRQVEMLKVEVAALGARNLTLENQLHAVYASRSWKFAEPVRWVGLRARSVRTLARVIRVLAREPDLIAGTYRSVVKQWRAEGFHGVKKARAPPLGP
ncbi:MAG: hypothetical protein EON56_05465 [Alphaproteobacteria bacterium]|nr:MAG: hypothetical protein EON56_05465 [Alphaproteobacteria bacterium]